MFWLLIIIFAICFIFYHPIFSFFLAAIFVSVIIYKKAKKQNPHSFPASSPSFLKDVSKNIGDNIPKENQPSISFDISYEYGQVTKNYPLLDVAQNPPLKYCEYNVRGKNPTTKRMKTNRLIAAFDASPDTITQKSGLLEPYTVTPYFDMPSDAQVSFAKDLNILYPENCNKIDMSCLISRQLEEIEGAFTNDKLLEYASMHNVYISPYSNDICGVDIMIHSLPTKDRIAFFVYLIYCGQIKCKVGNLHHLSNSHIFYGFADTVPDIDETGKYIKEHCTQKFLQTYRVDRRNGKMAQLEDLILEYLNKTILFIKNS